MRNFTKDEIKEVEKLRDEAISSLDSLSAFLADKIDAIDEWVDERSEKWQESESAEIVDTFRCNVDDLRDEFENIKQELEELNIDFL